MGLDGDKIIVNRIPAIGVDGTVYLGSEGELSILLMVLLDIPYGYIFYITLVLLQLLLELMELPMYPVMVSCMLIILMEVKNGKLANTSSAFSNPTIGVNGTIYAPYNQGLLALDISSGNLTWMWGSGQGVSNYTTVIEVGGTVYFGSTDYCFYALYSCSGLERWKY